MAIFNVTILISHQLKLKKMRAEFANLNHCGVPFLGRAVVKLCCYTIHYTIYTIQLHITSELSYVVWEMTIYYGFYLLTWDNGGFALVFVLWLLWAVLTLAILLCMEGKLIVLNTIQYTVYTIHSIVYTIHHIVNDVSCILYTIQYTLYTVQYIPYGVYYILYSVSHADTYTTIICNI